MKSRYIIHRCDECLQKFKLIWKSDDDYIQVNNCPFCGNVIEVDEED